MKHKVPIEKHLISKVLLRRFVWVLGFMCFLISAEFASAQENYEIRKIYFNGNKTFSKSELLNYTLIRESNLYTRKIQKKESSLFHEEYVQLDVERIHRFYQTQGFLDAQVIYDSVRIVNDKKKRVDVYFSVTEGDPVKVDSVRIEWQGDLGGINKDSLAEKIKKNLSMKKSERFIDQNIHSDLSLLNYNLSNLGHVYAKSDFRLQVDASNKTTDVNYTVTPGPLCNFGDITITGLNYVKEKHIRKRLNFAKGELYSSEKIDKTRQETYDLQLFRIVSLSPQTDRNTQKSDIDIHIQIQEMPRWMTRYGLGYGTEDKFRAFADVTYRGLFGGTSRLNFYAKHSALVPYRFSVTWIEPQFLHKKLSLSVNPYIEKKAEPGYTTQTYGLNLPLTYTINQKVRTSLSYYWENVTQHLESNDVDVPNPEDERFLYSKSGLLGTFAFNNADPLFSPTKGMSLSIGAKLNGYIFGGDFNYTRLWVDARKYIKMREFVLSLRAMLGGIHSSDEEGFIPVEDRFYSGGSNSNRGWARSMLGPKRASGTPLGGKSIVELNAEIRHPLFWILEIAAFVDASNIWSGAYNYDFGGLAYAVGGGLRINTPIGPIRLDVGVPVMNEKKSVQFFISVGQAF